MSDVEIIFPNSKAPLAERLREAIFRTGYEVAPGGGVAPGEAPAPSDARAILLLWDRTSIQQPGLKEAAAAARHRGRAIDVSADGITPLDLADESRLIQLSAWRGEPHHPGWKKILAELERLCGGHRGALAHGRAALSHAPAPTTRASAAAAGAARTRGGAKLAVMGVAIVLALLLVGFAAMSGRSLDLDGTPPATKPVAVAQPMAAPTSGTLPAAAPSAVSGDAQAAAPPALGTGEPATTPGAPSPATPQLAQAGQPVVVPSGGSGGDRRASHARPARQRLPGVVRYTKYAKTMRLFCQRSGRHTPQCRMFNANLANAGR